MREPYSPELPGVSNGKSPSAFLPVFMLYCRVRHFRGAVRAALGKPCHKPQSCPLGSQPRGLEAPSGCSKGGRSQYENKPLRIINSTKGNQWLVQPAPRSRVQPAVTHPSPQSRNQPQGVPGDGQLLSKTCSPPTGCAIPHRAEVPGIGPRLPVP